MGKSREIGFVDRGVLPHERGGFDSRNPRGARRLRDTSGDPLVDRRNDLGAVLPVHLVAVVNRRIVRGSDHDSRGGAEMADGEREKGSGVRAL